MRCLDFVWVRLCVGAGGCIGKGGRDAGNGWK